MKNCIRAGTEEIISINRIKAPENSEAFIIYFKLKDQPVSHSP